MQSRNIDLDCLKGLAIIAIVMYHIGVLPFGYLGVDLFFCLNGYFITKVIWRGMDDGSFSYGGFLRDRLLRLWPVLLLVSAAALLIGYFVMLPDDYENLGNAAVASGVFANNILANITIMDYWAVRNAFQPLMHTWYIGVLVQCYIVFPAIVCCCRLRWHNAGRWIMWTLLAASLAIYLFGDFADNDKFYYLPFRLFEFLAGAMVAVYSPRIGHVGRPWLWRCSLVALIVACFLGVVDMPNELRVTTVVMLTVAALWLFTNITGSPRNRSVVLSSLALVGAMSFNIYLWHQVIIAFYRYCVSVTANAADIAIVIGLTAVLSVASYLAVERQLSIRRTPAARNRLFALCIAAAVAVCATGLYVHMVSGVVRDVPELGITRRLSHSGMHSEYNDRIYDLDRPFNDEASPKVLIVGNSFARDFANVLMESAYADSVDISYRFSEEPDSSLLERIKQADIIFIESLRKYTGLRRQAIDSLTKAPVYLIGTKSFGISNGRVYIHRNSPDYWSLTELPDKYYYDEYLRERQECDSACYIDFMTPVLYTDGRVRVFTDDSLFISQDCRHLTPGGAAYYARLLSPALTSIFGTR